MSITPSPKSSLTLTIDGMSCGHCVQAVTRALESTPGISVRSVAVGTAQVDASGPTSAAAALAAIGRAGYQARVSEPAGQPERSGCGCCAAASPEARCG